MAAICHQFVQNAWKKDLCSNCFKCKEEHNGGTACKSRYLATMYPSRAHSWRAPQSILKNSHQTCRSKHSAVHFPAEESQIIGFGGGECFSSDGEDITEQEDSAAGSDGEEGEEEQALQRLTRTNTDFNTNLSHSGLQLGKPVTDSEGKRKTLLVSVTPYSLPHQNSKDILLKSLSKCDEIIQDDCKISEVQTESNIDPDSQKQEGMNFLLDKSKDLENVSLVTKSQQNEAIVFDSTDESVKPRESKSDDEVINTKISDTGTSHISIYSKEICKDKCQELEIPASTVLDNEKCTDSSKHKEILPDLISNGEKRRESARIQDISSNFPSNRENLNDIPKLPETSSGINKETCRDTAKLLTLSPPLMSNKDKFKDIPKLTESINNTTFSKGKFRDLKQINIEPVSRFGMKTTMESRIPIIKTRPKPAVRKSYDLVKKNDIFVKKVPDLIHKSTEQNLNLAPQKKDSDENIVQVNNISESIIQVNISKTDNSKKETSTSEPLIEGESKEAHPKECEDMFSMEESRELAGEPDGRADPDEPGEPPALPRSPPPIIDPRPSFLHTLVKPKIPAKPITKLLQTTPRRIIPSREDIQVPETDAARVPKRQAPKPPPVPIEEVPCSTFLSKAATKETTCSYEVSSECPEPAPRKSLSVSVESLSTPEPEKKKSSSGKARFSLRKLLRLGASREEKIGSCEVSQTEEVPIPRPRLEIIHPSELNGSNVEVLGRIMDETETGRPAKPPPPPRNQSLAIEGFNRPARPPPPKSAELLRQQKQVKDELPTTAQSCGNLYANLDLFAGEVRSGLTPSKPQRSSSIRDCSSEGPRRRASEEPVYECVRYKRSASLPYCSSEAGSDIYSPYSLYSDDVGDNDSEWSLASGHPCKTSKLRLRKGRSVVHKSLEDNYGAVIVANHEALAQVLEQVHIGTLVPPALRGLKTALNVRWIDFSVQEDACIVVARQAFHPAVWGSHPVTLTVTTDQSLQTRGCLCPFAEFSDLVPARFLPGESQIGTELIQACVGVLMRLQVDTITSYGLVLRNRMSDEERHRDGSFVLLQLINTLKSLQADGIEEASIGSFALCREDRDAQPRLCVLRGPREETSLCQCALQALDELLPSAPLTPVLRDLLQQERAVSLSQVKSVLEFSLWGPADLSLGTDREMVLQRWLDLERATILHGLVRSRVELSALEECHLLFLVRTSAKTMCEASLLLDSETTSF